MKYISKTKNGYQLVKQLNGKMTTIGTDKNYDKIKKIRDYLIKHDWEDNVVQEMKNKLNKSNYIYKSHKGFMIIKYVNKKRYYYGHYTTREEANKQVKFLKQNNWNPIYAKTTGRKNNNDITMRYIFKYDNKYGIRKRIGEEYLSYGVFDSLEEAQKERDLLIKYDWDYETLCNHPLEEEFNPNQSICKKAHNIFYKPDTG